jgi:hypothetical protein
MRTSDRIDEVETFVERLGGRVGLRGVLSDLDRSAERVRVPASAATWGFRWDREDSWSSRWWPQGISTCADAWDVDVVDNRSVLMTSSYSRPVDGLGMGSRLTFVDLTDLDAIRYRHVLLVEPFIRDDGRVDVRPVQVHAGGIVWHGDFVHVAGTERGLSSFHLDDVVRVPAGDASRLRIRDEPPATVDAFGHRYLLPVRFTYDAGTAAGVRRMRYSFASLDRSTTPHAVVVGEYGQGRYPTRLARYPVDPVTSLLHADEGASHPTLLSYGGVPRMQGAAVVDGTWFVTTSNGSLRRGSVWVGEPGQLDERRRVLPVGPEDVAYWPQKDELWSVSEYPGARYVFAMSRKRLLGD